ncbi:uncharacterized protein LOC108021993 [Drosophila biarmipes]|uniref:uncharacterized protein LOC108021993 n=1 Tax=Drosophila biarmipes TaxID=125945 RepID=UPI0007E5F0A5|nr:uncharacterized protein LOC108021993 [Drosophila biarmipes]
MGRSKAKRKVHLYRPLENRKKIVEDYYLTAEQVRRIVQRWYFIWNPLSDSESECSSVAESPLKDATAYGDWPLPGGKFDFETTGRAILMNLSNYPAPEVIYPPVSLASVVPNTLRINSPPYITHTIFEHVMEDICERAKTYVNPPECEGAVGYDRRSLPIRRNNDEESWMDGRYCAKLFVELNEPLVDYAKLRRLPKRKRPPSRRNKLLAGLKRIKLARRNTKWKRPRARLVFQSETERLYQPWAVFEEEPLPSDDYYVEYANEDFDLEPEQSWHSSADEELMPKVTHSQSDFTLDYVRTCARLRRCHSLGSF